MRRQEGQGASGPQRYPARAPVIEAQAAGRSAIGNYLAYAAFAVQTNGRLLVRLLTLILIGAAFLINLYGLGAFAYALADATLHPSPDTPPGAIWGWDIIWDILPGLVTLTGLGLAFVQIIRKVR
jgi:hypothetical protein